MLRRSLVASALFTGLVLSAVAPMAAARPAQSRLVLEDCFENVALFPIPRDDARTYLPGGFEPNGAPADQDSTTNLYVRSLFCGDPASPRIEMITTYMSVTPPKRLAAKEGSDLYILHTGAEGPDATSLTASLCLGDLVEQADITVTQQRAQSPLGFGPEAGVARTSVTSAFLSTEFVVAAEGSTTPMWDRARWFFGNGRTYFDAFYELRVWGIGSSTVAFTQPYLELPPAGSGASVQSLADITLTGCTRK